MNTKGEKTRWMELLLAGLLQHGTWLACGVTALGLALELIEGRALSSTRIVRAGIACFILLPVTRVLLTLIVFVREGDHPFIAITALVLTIILAGFVIGGL
ncbi:MAG TPA: DUF1634 domain-containing protein [Bryobacteraceae bacterium]|jgi:uncharacterized membrane protein